MIVCLKKILRCTNKRKLVKVSQTTMAIEEYETIPNTQKTTEAVIQFDRTVQIDWILPIAINILLIVSTLWLLISLIHYGIRTKKWNHSHTQSNMHIINSGLVYSSVIACAVLCMARYSVSLALFCTGFNEDENELCDSLADAAYGTYAFVLCFVASFLWSRQRAFYTHRLLNVNYNKVIKFFSFISIAFIVGYGMFVIILNTLPNQYKASPNGCVRQIDDNQMANWVAAVVGVAFFNLVLLGLFSYALTHVQTFQKTEASILQQLQTSHVTGNSMKCKDSIKTGSIYKRQSLSKCNSIEAPGASHRKLQRRYSSATKIKLILQKTLIFAIISILVDVFLQIFANYIVNPNGHRRITNLLFDISAFFHLLFIIFSFAKYKEMMTSPCRKFHSSRSFSALH